MKRILLIILATFVGPLFALHDGGDYQVGYALDTVSPRYLPFSNLEHRRWENNNIPWWYNPSGQQYGTEETVQAIQLAMNAWENVSGVNFVYMGTTNQSLANQKDDKFVIGWLDGATFLNRFGNYWAYSQIWWNGQYVTDGEISINADRFSARNIGAFQGIITHELGHTLGLDHSDQSLSIMYSSPYHTADYQKTLRLDDILAASVLYPEQNSRLISVNCDGIVTEELDIYLPVITLDVATQRLWATLEYSGVNMQGQLVWTLGDFGYISDIVDDVDQYDFECSTTVSGSDLGIDIPVARYEGTLDGFQYSATLTYSGKDSFNNDTWVLTELSN